MSGLADGVLLATAAIATILVAGGFALAAFSGWAARRVQAALPPQGLFVTVDGQAIHYLDRGEGPVLLMIHGLGGQLRNFTYGLVDQLAGEFRVVVMERPGSGYSQRPRGGSATLRSQASTVARFIEALQLPPPVVVGHSMGGAVGLALALDHPELVSGLAIISPLTRPQLHAPAPFQRLAIRSPLLRWVVAWTVATPMALVRRKSVLRALFGPEPAPRDFALRGGGALGLRPRSFYAASSDMVAVNEDLPGMVAGYGRLKLPVGVIFGDGDRVLDCEIQGEQAARAIAGAEFERLEGAGHMIPVTQPEQVATFVRRIARRAGGSGASALPQGAP